MTDERFQELLFDLEAPQEPMAQIVRLELALREALRAGGEKAEVAVLVLLLQLNQQDERGAHHEQRATV
jgi:hypothetical protein